MKDNNDIREIMRRVKESEADYPRDLKTATRAELTTLIRKKKGPGCPLMGGAILGMFILIVNLIF